MNVTEIYNQCQGHFVNVRFIEEDEFIKTVFVRTSTADHGQIRRSFIYADIVPDGNEEEYLKTYAENPDAFQRIPLPEGEIAEIKLGNRIAW